MSTQAATRAPRERMGCASGLWPMFQLPFLFLRAIPWIGEILRHEAATTTGERAQASFEQLTPAANPGAVTAVLVAEQAESPAGVGGALRQLRMADPAFDITGFLDGARVAVGAYTTAQFGRDDRLLRRITTPGFWGIPAAGDRRRAGTAPSRTSSGRTARR
jgi:hypothetical protein